MHRKTLAGAEAWSLRTGIYLLLDETGDPQPIINGVVATSFPTGAWVQSDQYFQQFMWEAANSGRYAGIIAWGGGQYWGPYLYGDYPQNNRYTATGATNELMAVALGQ